MTPTDEHNVVSVLTAPGALGVEDRDTPVPAEGDALVRVASVGVCGSDVHYFEHGRIGDFVVTGPLVLGHEASGTIVAVGPGVDGTRIGERVAIEPQRTCGSCRECVRGRYNLCESVIFFATPPIDGAFARYVTAPAARCHRVPDGLSDDEAALIEPLAVAVWANLKAATSPGDTVLVSGAGPVGILCAQVAMARGADSVIVIDINSDRLEVAADLGAETVNSAQGEFISARPDVFLECTGAQSAVDAGIRSLAPAARVVLVGMAATVELPLDLVQSRELVITGTFRYANVYPSAIALAASGRVDLSVLVTSHWDLEHVSDALTAARRSTREMKAMVHP